MTPDDFLKLFGESGEVRISCSKSKSGNDYWLIQLSSPSVNVSGHTTFLECAEAALEFKSRTELYRLGEV